MEVMISRNLYEGAKEMCWLMMVENREFLKELLESMYGELPTPKPKKKN